MKTILAGLAAFLLGYAYRGVVERYRRTATALLGEWEPWEPYRDAYPDSLAGCTRWPLTMPTLA